MVKKKTIKNNNKYATKDEILQSLTEDNELDEFKKYIL